MPVLNFVLLLILTILQTMLQQSIVLILFKLNHQIKHVFLTSVLIAFTSEVLTFFGAPEIVVILSWLLILSASYTILHRQQIKKSVFMAISQLAGVSLFEYLFLFVLLFASKNTFNPYENQLTLRFVVVLLLLMVYALIHRKSKYILYRNMNNLQSKAIVFLLFLFLLTLPIIINIQKNKLFSLTPFETYSFVLSISFCAYNLFYIYNIFKMSHIAQQLEVQQLYSSTLEKSLDDLRGFKHDFANILNTISGYLDIGDYSSLDEYMANLNVDFLKIQTSEVLNSNFKEIPLLYGVILSKLSLAELRGIRFQVSVQCILSLKYCNPVDFSRMVGVLLDNALEAAAESQNKHVELVITNKRGQLHILVSNSCDQPVDTLQIFQKSFTTKQAHSGLGLAFISQTIQKYQVLGYAMSISTKQELGEFSQLLVV